MLFLQLVLFDNSRTTIVQHSTVKVYIKEGERENGMLQDELLNPRPKLESTSESTSTESSWKQVLFWIERFLLSISSDSESNSTASFLLLNRNNGSANPNNTGEPIIWKLSIPFLSNTAFLSFGVCLLMAFLAAFLLCFNYFESRQVLYKIKLEEASDDGASCWCKPRRQRPRRGREQLERRSTKSMSIEEASTRSLDIETSKSLSEYKRQCESTNNTLLDQGGAIKEYQE